MFSTRLQEFLILGPSPDFTASAAYDDLRDECKTMDVTSEQASNRSKDRLKKLHMATTILQTEWEQHKEEECILQDQIDIILAKVNHMQSILGATDVHTKLKLHAELTVKIQLLTLADTLNNLLNFSHVSAIPTLVFGVVNSLPSYIPETATIRRRMHDVVQEVKSALLTSFHTEFESHLEQKRDANDAKAMWSSFLGGARDWLLGFALVSLLPLLISDAQSLIMERYTEALDEALTPLWGRFHFHLTSARESRSVDQLVWTFNYAKSFVAMLIDLCTQLTSAGQLQRLHAGDYKTVALVHIVDKSIRFMRAHLAQSIVDFSPMTRIVCAQVVERSLDLDSTLAKYTIALPPLSISAVLYDARAVHQLWVESDREFFTQFMVKVCGESTDIIYGFRTAFHQQSTERGANEVSTSPSSSSSSTSKRQSRCYHGIYDCLYVFSLALKRYENLPTASHDIFSGAILEPLLAIAVALFLYRIRANLALYCIANGLLPYSEPLSRNPETNELHAPQTLVDFFDSVQYFQLSLGALISSSSSSPSSSSSSSSTVRNRKASKQR